MKTIEKYKFVYIVWEDSVGCSSGWQVLETAEKQFAPLNISTGFIIKETKRYKTICPHISFEDGIDFSHYAGMGIMTIPNSAIRLCKKIKIPTYSI